MPAELIADLPLPVNHVFVDFENVHKIDLTVIGKRAVSFILLVGPRQTKISVDLVEKLFEHAVSVQLVRLTSPGKNALDFALAYYLGRAVAADPTGCFHIVSKDTGYDPLIQHLRAKRIEVHRHDSFGSLFVGGVSTKVAASKPKASAKPKAVKLPILDARVIQVMEHFRRPSATRPRSQEKLVSFLVAHHGHKITELEALSIIVNLRQAGYLTVGEKGRVTYHLGPGDSAPRG